MSPLQALLPINEETLIITTDTLTSVDGDRSIQYLITSVYEQSPLIITEAQVLGEPNDNKLILTGKSELPFGNMEVDAMCTLELIEGQGQLFVQYTLPDDWKFSDSFQDLPTVTRLDQLDDPLPSPLDDLNLSSALIYISSTTIEKGETSLSPGINFQADLEPDGFFYSVFNAYTDISIKLKLQGTINLSSDLSNWPVLDANEFPWSAETIPPGINLKASLEISPLQLGDTLQLSANELRIYSPISGETFAEMPTYLPTIAFTGSLKIPSANNFDLEITILRLPGTEEASIVGDFSKTPIKNFKDLRDLMGLDNGNSFLPTELKDGDFGGLGIKSAYLNLVKDPSLSVSCVYVAVGMPNLNWEVWPNQFSIDKLSANFKVSDPFNNPEVEISLSGQLTLAGEEVEVNAIQENNEEGNLFTLTANTKEGIKIPLKQLLSNYADNIDIAVPTVSDLQIDNIGVVIAPKQYYSLSIAMAQEPKPWEIALWDLKLSFSDLELFLKKSQSEAVSGNIHGTAMLGSASANFTEAPLDKPYLSLKANYNLPGDVELRGELPEVKIRDIVKWFSGKDSTEWMPSVLNDIAFEKSFLLITKEEECYNLALGTTIQAGASPPKDICRLAFVVQKAGADWGFAAGAEVHLDNLSDLLGEASGKAFTDKIGTLSDWIPVDKFTFAITSIKEPVFPDFASFQQPSLEASEEDSPQITLPSIPDRGKGFFLFVQSKFEKKDNNIKNRDIAIKNSLIDLLKIPEGTMIDAFLSYQKSEEGPEIQFGVGLTTYLMAKANKSPNLSHPYENVQFTGALMVEAEAEGTFGLSMSAQLKTLLPNISTENIIDFAEAVSADNKEETTRIINELIANQSKVKFNMKFELDASAEAVGLSMSGAMEPIDKPITIGPVQLGNLAAELGISINPETLVPLPPSMGFSAELTVGDGFYPFNFSFAFFVDGENPLKCMVAGSMSDLNIGDLYGSIFNQETINAVNAAAGTGIQQLDDLTIAVPDKLKMLGDGSNAKVVQQKAREFEKLLTSEELISVLKTIEIVGTQEGRFTIPLEGSIPLADGLDKYDGTKIAKAFKAYGKLDSFPSASPELMIFTSKGSTENSKKWFVTEQAGGQDPIITHWQIIENEDKTLEVSKEPQFYFVPNPDGINIATLEYKQGFMLSGRLEFLSYFVDADIELVLDQGIKVDAEMSEIRLSNVPDNFFSIKAMDGLGEIGNAGGPKVSICTYKQPNANPKEFIDPHFYINGNLLLLDGTYGVCANVTSEGLVFHLLVENNLVHGDMYVLLKDAHFDAGGSLEILSISLISLGPLGKWQLPNRIQADTQIWANKDSFGLSFQFLITFAGTTYTLKTKEEESTASFENLVISTEKKIENLIRGLLTEAKYYAECFFDKTITGVDNVALVLVNEFKKTEVETAKILKNVGFTLDEVGKFLLGLPGMSAKLMFECLVSAGFEVLKVLKYIKSAFNLTEMQMLHLLKEARYNIMTSVGYIKDVFGLGAGQMIKLLHEAGYGIGEIIEVTRTVFGLNLNEMVGLLKAAELGYGLNEITSGLANSYGPTPELMKSALEGAGFAGDKVLGAMKATGKFGMDALNKAFDIGGEIKDKLNDWKDKLNPFD